MHLGEYPVEYKSKLTSLGKSILSVVSQGMKSTVLDFDQLRSRIKSSLAHHRAPSLINQYQFASENLRDHLIEEHQKLSFEMHHETHTYSQAQALQHRLNVLKRILNHEWKVQLK